MSSRVSEVMRSRRVWSEQHAMRDQVMIVSVGLGVVLLMAIAFIVVSHTL